jgi:hypothetical protein
MHSNIMHDNMLVNPLGIPSHAMGIDMNIEHLIQYLKVSNNVTQLSSSQSNGIICG